MKKLSIILLLFFLYCKSCNLSKEINREESFEKCGECLHLNTGNVCTVEGTYFNSCLAICKQVKILCEGQCPCKKN